MELSGCNCKALLLAALIVASLCLHGPIGCSASAGSAGSMGAARTLPPDVRREAEQLGYGVQKHETAGPGASLSAFTSAATPPSSAGAVGWQRSGDDDGRTPAFESAANLKTARRLLVVGTDASSGHSCGSNYVPCPPPHHG